MSELNLAALATEYDNKSPQEILALAFEQFDDVWISFSGAEDVVLVDMACQLKKPVKVFSLDTGRLHPETYRLLEQVRNRYPVELEILSPDAIAVEQLVKTKGLFSFFNDGHKECCQIRKVAPLRRKLAGIQAWVTGQRKDQSEDTRASLPVIQADGGFSTPTNALVKFNPLANWSSQQVWQYIRDNAVPYNELHEKGFISIGCEPCTRPVLPNQHEREGRWWWEDAAKKECGLHSINVARK